MTTSTRITSRQAFFLFLLLIQENLDNQLECASHRLGYQDDQLEAPGCGSAVRSARPEGERADGRLVRRVRLRLRGHVERPHHRRVDEHAGRCREAVPPRVVPRRWHGAPQEPPHRVQSLGKLSLHISQCMSFYI